MNIATFRFYAELNDFLQPNWKYTSFVISFPSGQTVKHLVESCGVPHTEVDLILVNEISENFSYQVNDGDWVSVYPIFETIDISEVTVLRPSPLRETKFVLDCHLGRLAVYLRLLGFDVYYRNNFSDEELAEISEKDKRICLTRDRGLLKRNQIEHGYLIRTLDSREQTIEVIKRFQLLNQIKAFTRCTRCNGFLQPIEKEIISKQVLPGTREHFQEFSRCVDCGGIYWRGSHYERLKKIVDFVIDEIQSSSNNSL